MGAAKKAASRLFQKHGKTKFKFMISETTQGDSNKSSFTYTATVHKLNPPVKIGTNKDGEPILSHHNITLKACKTMM